MDSNHQPAGFTPAAPIRLVPRRKEIARPSLGAVVTPMRKAR